MPENENIGAMLRRLDTSERNHTDLAKAVTGIIEDQRDMHTALGDFKTDRAVRAERDKNLNERLDRIEKSIQGVHNLGWWVLTAFGASLILAISTFIFRGGLGAP